MGMKRLQKYYKKITAYWQFAKKMKAVVNASALEPTG